VVAIVHADSRGKHREALERIPLSAHNHVYDIRAGPHVADQSTVGRDPLFQSMLRAATNLQPGSSLPLNPVEQRHLDRATRRHATANRIDEFLLAD
jgi:hypothetical protein